MMMASRACDGFMIIDNYHERQESFFLIKLI